MRDNVQVVAGGTGAVYQKQVTATTDGAVKMQRLAKPEVSSLLQHLPPSRTHHQRRAGYSTVGFAEPVGITRTAGWRC